jgi:hypothetical protein
LFAQDVITENLLKINFKMKNKLELLNYEDYCKETIRKKIEDYKDIEVYASDLSSYITEWMNVDGSATYSTHKAKRYLKEWWWEAVDYFEYVKQNFGQNIHNPFKYPEKFMVAMIIQGVDILISQCSIIGKKWNEKIKITQRVINKILNEIENLKIELI